MVKQRITIVNRLGLHARPGGIFSKECAKFPCKVEIEKEDKKVDAKSILGILMLKAKCGTEVDLICTGEDEQQTLEHLVAFVATLPD